MHIHELARFLWRQIGRTHPGRSVSGERKQSSGPRAETVPGSGPSEATPSAWPAEAASVSLTKAFSPLSLSAWWAVDGGADRPERPPERSDDEREGDGGEDIVLQTRAGAGGQLVALQLTPPGLGPLTVVLSFADGTMQAQIVAEDPESARRIASRTSELRRSLAEAWDVKDIRVIHRSPGDDAEPTETPRTETRPPFDQKA